MSKYTVNIRVEGVEGTDPKEVRDALRAKLTKAEVGTCRILSIEPVKRRSAAPQNQKFTPRVAPAEGAWRRQSNAAGLLLLFAAGWVVWLFWSYAEMYLSSN